MTSKYNSPFSVGKRQTVFIDPKDPRVRGWKAGITAARLGAELKIVDSSGISPAGTFSYLKGAAKTSSTPNKNFDPKSEDQGVNLAVISNINAVWNGTTLVITFDFDLSDELNKLVQGFKYKLTGDGVQSILIPFINLNRDGIQQTIEFTPELNQAYFGEFATSFSLLEIFAYDSFGNVSNTITYSSIPPYSSDLPAPVITVTAINQGYSVDWEPITESYTYISIEEIISDAETAPTTGYTGIYLDEIKPATIITPTLATRWVKARFTNVAGYGPYSIAHKVTPESPVAVDNTPPPAPASGSATAGIDNSAGATIGFNAYIDITWSAVSDLTLRGYRIRFRESGTSNPYSYVDSPGTGTSFRLTGLSIGTTYEIGVASYDEFNNTTGTYTSVGTATATGTPFIGKNVTTVGYFGASATGDTGTFKFGYGVQDSGGIKRGLVFNANNYWYIDSDQSATFKLGGDTNNYIQWDGSSFVVQGDLRARAGNFQGNVQIISGGSIYSGTLSGNNLSGAGFIINNSGLLFNSSTENGTTIINGETGLFTTKSANIGGWLISPTTNPNSLYQTVSGNTIKLDSAVGSVSASGTGYSAGFGVPDAGEIVFWAGSRSTDGNFYVTKNGSLKALTATLRGKLETGNPEVQSVMSFGAAAGPLGQDGIHINDVNFWYATAQFSLGGGKITGTSNSVNINAGTKIFVNASLNADKTFGDSTLVQDADTGELTLGRAFFFGGTTNPNTGDPSGGVITNRSEYNNGVQGTGAFNAGDIWLQRA